MKFDENGLLPAIAQDAQNGEVLMLAYMNQEALDKTLSTRKAWFYSRSRQELWHKGATSGNYLNVKKVLIDCDEDTILLQVDATGPACHTGNRSCFFRELSGVPKDLQMELAMAWRTNAASQSTKMFVETAIEIARELYSTKNEDRPFSTKAAS